MAGNGFPRAGRSGRTPHFLTVGLLVVICILAFNYWNVSSQNKILQKERSEMTRHLEELALKRVHLEKRSEVLDQQLKTNNMEVQALTNDKNSCQENLRDTGEERDQCKAKMYESESELKELRMQVEDTNATVDRQKGELQSLQQQLDIKQGDMYRIEDILKDTEEKLANANEENARLQQQLIDIQQRPQQPPLNPGVPQMEKNVPPLYQQPQLALPVGVGQPQQPQQPYPGRENVPPLSSNNIIVPNRNLKVPEVPNVYQRIDDYQPRNVPLYDANAVPKSGDALVVPNLQALPQDNEIRDNIKIRIEDKPLDGNVPLEHDQQIDRPVDFQMNQDTLNKDPGMVDQIGDEEGRKEDDIEIVGEEGRENGGDLEGADNGVMDHDSDGVGDEESDVGSDSQGAQALEHQDGGIDAGQPSTQDDEGHIPLFRDGVQDDGDSQSESDYDFNRDDDDDDEKDEDMKDEEEREDIDQDNKLRFEPNQEENHLNPVPAY